MIKPRRNALHGRFNVMDYQLDNKNTTGSVQSPSTNSGQALSKRRPLPTEAHCAAKKFSMREKYTDFLFNRTPRVRPTDEWSLKMSVPGRTQEGVWVQITAAPFWLLSC